MHYRYLLFLFIISVSGHCCAQEHADTASGFMPQDKVIFEDDFSNNKNKALPAGWYMEGPCDDRKIFFANKYCFVENTGDTACLVIKPVPEKTLENFIMADLANDAHLPNSFTLEYDFAMETINTQATLFFTYSRRCLLQTYSITTGGDGALEFSCLGWTAEPVHIAKYAKTLPANNNQTYWRHFALAYNKGMLSCYVDNVKVFSTPDCGYEPIHFGFTSNDGDGAMKLTNLRLATGGFIPAAEVLDLKKLLTEKKLTTHAIHYDVNSAIIKPESMPFIKQLASFLKLQTALRLEIDGHTDNDGTPQHNGQLSKQRAAEVKKQLISFGVAGSRIVPKGFGSTQPVSENTSEVGKAVNRRIEFKVIN